MSRLFIRFYLAVLFILFVAFAVQNFISYQRNESHDIRVVEEALAGGVRLARESFTAFPQIKREDMLEIIQQRFAYPVEIVAISDIPSRVEERFSSGQDVVYHNSPVGGMVLTAMPGGKEALSFGPLPRFAEPSRAEELTGLALILALAAGAIAFLLRPVAQQFRLIETTALQVADGDFSARVDERKVTSTRTIATAFNLMASRTEALLRTQRELLQAVSHELRTPLSRIRFAVDLIRSSKDDNEREQRLQSVEIATEELDGLVGELLRYVRMETGEPELHVSEIRLLPLVNGLIEKISVLHAEKNFRVGENLAQGNVTIHADQAGLERALGNLLSNAGRFAGQQILIEAADTADDVVITVDDDGAGIPETDRERVFDPFVRLDESDSGAGIGLALVRRILDHHGGSIQAEQSGFGGCRMRTRWPSHETVTPPSADSQTS